MTHVVLSEKVECPRCKKLHSGAAVHITKDFYACTKCFYEDFYPKAYYEFFKIPKTDSATQGQ